MNTVGQWIIRRRNDTVQMKEFGLRQKWFVERCSQPGLDTRRGDLDRAMELGLEGAMLLTLRSLFLERHPFVW